MIEKAPKFSSSIEAISLMAKLEAEGTMKEIQDNYYFWDKIKYKNKDYTANDVWFAVKQHRYLRNKKVNFGNYTFSYMITDYIEKALHEFDLNIGSALGSDIGIAETDKTKFIISSIMEEAISSSQMEGANTTRKRAKEMIQHEKKPSTKSEQMIMNNFITMKYIVEHKNEEITPNKILYIHQLISIKTLEDNKDEGRFRTNDDIHVVNFSNGEVVHFPPPMKELATLIQDFCDFFNKSSENFIHPIIKACIIHFMIGWIHPFTDGNGRTARALFYWYMLKQGYWLTEYQSISLIIKNTKSQYEKAFIYSELDDNDLNYFINYHIKTMEKAYEELKNISIKNKKKFFKQYNS